METLFRDRIVGCAVAPAAQHPAGKTFRQTRSRQRTLSTKERDERDEPEFDIFNLNRFDENPYEKRERGVGQSFGAPFSISVFPLT